MDNITLDSLSFMQREELFRTLRISLTHHSNAIEGTTLSYGETQALLQTGITASNKSLDEQLVILGFANAYDMVVREANDKQKPLSSEFIKDLHAVIFENAQRICPHLVKTPIGAYRTDYASIRGADVELATPSQIPQRLDNLIYTNPSNKLTLEQIARFHIEYEQIHPFSDGNGRTGRLLIHFQCIQNNFIPPLIELEKRQEYLNALAQDSTNAMFEILKQGQEASLKLIERQVTN